MARKATMEPEAPVLSRDMSPENKKRFDINGRELLDPTPMQPPLGYKRQPSLAEQIRQGVIAAKLDEAYAMEETEEEADDFEIGDDFEPISPHENDHVPTLAVLKAEAKRLNKEITKAQLEKAKAAAKPPPLKKEEPETETPQT